MEPSIGDLGWYLTSHAQPGAIVSGGSADSVLTSAEVLRRMRGETAVIVTRTENLAEVDVERWPEDTRVVLVGLAVDKPQPTATTAFLEAMRRSDHTLLAVVDEHSRHEWRRVLESAEIPLDTLLVEPQSQDDTSAFRSAGSVLRKALGRHADTHSLALLRAADDCDRWAHDSSALAYLVNAVLKSRENDEGRKEALVRWLAASSHVVALAEQAGRSEAIAGVLSAHGEDNGEVLEWVGEYAALEREHARLLREARDEGEGIVSFSIERPVDLTVLGKQFYDAGAKVLVFEKEFHRRGGSPIRELGLGTNVRKLNIFEALREAGLETKGMRHKPRVALKDGPRALDVVREHLRAVLGDGKEEAL